MHTMLFLMPRKLCKLLNDVCMATSHTLCIRRRDKARTRRWLKGSESEPGYCDAERHTRTCIN
jgi:hypothetical protein